VRLFPEIIGADFAALDPCLQGIHGGESKTWQGTVTVERGVSLIARALGILASLPPAMRAAPIEIRIEATSRGERWSRLFAHRHRMASTLYRKDDLLVERLGPAALTFRLLVQRGALKWQLARVSVARIPLPLAWFQIFAKLDARDGRYHFVVDSSLLKFGRIVRYEGLLDASA
jgi:hypothetical protein